MLCQVLSSLDTACKHFGTEQVSSPCSVVNIKSICLVLPRYREQEPEVVLLSFHLKERSFSRSHNRSVTQQGSGKEKTKSKARLRSLETERQLKQSLGSGGFSLPSSPLARERQHPQDEQLGHYKASCGEGFL